MKTENYTRPLPGWTARWPKPPLAAIGLLALCVASCKSPQTWTNTSSLSSDSLYNVKGFALIQQPVPLSMAKTTFPTKMLDAIPVGTGFSKRSGQATVEVKRITEDSLQVTATCDSLARQVIILTKEINRIRQENLKSLQENETKKNKEPNAWQWFWIRTGQIAVAALLLISTYRRFKQYIKKT